MRPHDGVLHFWTCTGTPPAATADVSVADDGDEADSYDEERVGGRASRSGLDRPVPGLLRRHP